MHIRIESFRHRRFGEFIVSISDMFAQHVSKLLKVIYVSYWKVDSHVEGPIKCNDVPHSLINVYNVIEGTFPIN